MGLNLTAPAKINLSLHITGKRDDEYHLLESLVVFSHFGDELTVSEDDRIHLEIVGNFSQSLLKENEADNLAMRAAFALRHYARIQKGAHIALHKRIPVGAGLGGGSADAAATLRALRRLWKIDCGDDILQQIAATLGSDVPVCVGSETSWMCGVGEKLSSCHLGFAPGIVLVNPRISLPTKDVFAAYMADYSHPGAMPSHIYDMQALMGYMMASHNALQQPAITIQPVIAEILASIASSPSCRISRMSGSGATCFGLYDNEAMAIEAANHIRKEHSGWWVMASHIAPKASM
jgi:4-diphosphocytidyl-2-C-methyl-D-erythritol kinase